MTNPHAVPPRPVSLTPEEKGRILAELSQLREGFQELEDRITASEKRSKDRFDLLRKGLEDLSNGFIGLRTDLKVGQKVDETQNTQIAKVQEVQAKFSTRDKLGIGAFITAVVAIAQAAHAYYASQQPQPKPAPQPPATVAAPASSTAP